MTRHELLAARVMWCPPCVSRAQGRGTVRTIDTLDGQRLALTMGDRVAGELWSIIPPEGARCSACGEPVRVAFEARKCSMKHNGYHPGLVLLRELIPDTEARRAFVKRACSRDEWYAPDLIRAVNDANESKPVNVTPQQAALVREFIESHARKGRGLGQRPSEGAQRPLPFGRRRG